MISGDRLEEPGQRGAFSVASVCVSVQRPTTVYLCCHHHQHLTFSVTLNVLDKVALSATVTHFLAHSVSLSMNKKLTTTCKPFKQSFESAKRLS